MPDRAHAIAHRGSASRRMRPGPAARRQGFSTATRLVLQPALKVGAVNDPMEREAEVMAERVTAMPAPAVAASAASSPPTPPQARRAAEDQPDLDSLEQAPPIPDDHQDPDVPPAEDVTTEALSGQDMQEIETGEPKDTAGDPPVSESGGDAPAMPDRSGQAAVVGAEGGAAPADVAQRVAQPGAGRPLPSSLSAFMELRFNRSFADVRLHDEPQDKQAAARIGARAFTHRNHIWIGEGESAENRKLMAHELTHVVQQTAPEPVRNIPRSSDGEEPQVRRGIIANEAEKLARDIPGYRLISLILGKSPITGDTVIRNATNVLGALLSLIPGGNLLFERLEESRVIERAFEWIWDQIQTLNITWTRIKSLIEKLLDNLPVWPSDAIAYAERLFKPLVDDVLTFIGNVTMKILEFIFHGALKLAGPWGDKIWDIIQRAGEAIKAILDDPLGFAKNLFSAVIKGFSQFGENVVGHLKRGLLGWLFGAIQGLDIQIPEKLDFKGLISIGLQIVGLTYASFRKQLVKRLGDNGERKVSFLEKSVEVVKILLKEGFAGLWQRALQMIDNFKETLVGGIQGFVIESLIMGGLSWLAGLTNPVGAVIKIALAIYNMIKTFLERLDQILAVAEAIFSSITNIAAGRVQAAADFIEKTIASVIPVIISFLAALVPITGIVNSIHKIINKLRDAVTRAIDKMITFIVKKAKKLFSKLIGKLNNLRKLPSVNFTFGKKQHRIYAEKRGKKVEVLVASGTGHTLDEVKADAQKQKEKIKDKSASAEAAEIISEVGEAKKETDEKKNLDVESQKENHSKGFQALEAELREAAEELHEAGSNTATFSEIETNVSEFLFRAKEPRFETIEAMGGTYEQLKAVTAKPIPKDESERSYSQFYENDHIPEKQIPKAIINNLALFKPGGGGDSVDRGSEKADAPPNDTKNASPKIGKLGSEIKEIDDDGKSLPAITLYRPIHRNKTRKTTINYKALDTQLKMAGKEKDPVASVKKLVSGSIKKELEVIVEEVKGDASATDVIKTNLDSTAKLVLDKNVSIYELDKLDPPPTAQGPDDPKAQSLSDLPIGGNPDAGIPNFLEIEGQYSEYGKKQKNVGNYIEYDHVIAKSWPLQTASLMFGHRTLRASLEVALKSANFEPDKKEQAERLEQLDQTPVFPATHRMSHYTEANGGAIALYRPMHLAVTKKDETPRNPDLPAKSMSADFAKPLARYIVNGDAPSLIQARRAAYSDVEKRFETAFNVHENAIAEVYLNELRAVKKVNSGKENQAQQAMVKISTSVKKSLEKARTATMALFD